MDIEIKTWLYDILNAIDIVNCVIGMNLNPILNFS
jgi:hypothetical protein